jgi:ankyrin repeat protein
MDIRHQINPLHKAAADNKTDVIKNLINQGTPLDCETDRKWTPLHYATIRGHVEATRLLVEKGASIEKVSREGYTPLQHAMDFAKRHQDAESQGKFLEIKRRAFI